MNTKPHASFLPFCCSHQFFHGENPIYLFSLFTGEVYYCNLNEEGFCFIHKSRQKACIVNVSTVTKRCEKCNTQCTSIHSTVTQSVLAEAYNISP